MIKIALVLGLMSSACIGQFSDGCTDNYAPGWNYLRRALEIRFPGFNAHSTYKVDDTCEMDIWVHYPCDAYHQVWVSLDSGRTYDHMVARYLCDTASMYQELPARFDPGWNIKVPWVPTDLTDSTYQKVMFLVYCEECKHNVTETNETTVINYRPASAVSRMKPIRTGSVSGRPRAYYTIRGRRVGPDHLWRSPVISPDGLHVLPFERKQ
jgi:hypothetical protein